MTVLCMASCARKGRHIGDCDQERCTGCEPWPAHDGWRVCLRCGEHIGTDAIEAAQLYDALALMLAGGGSVPGEKTSGSKTSIGINLNDTVVETRRAIRHTLASWTLLVAEERGLSLPETALRATQNGEHVEAEVQACGAFLAVHADWLAAHNTAGDVADELSALARAGRAAAYPSGARRRDLKILCPHDGCDGGIYAIIRSRDTLLPPSVHCDGPDQHSWASHEWHRLREARVSA